MTRVSDPVGMTNMVPWMVVSRARISISKLARKMAAA